MKDKIVQIIQTALKNSDTHEVLKRLNEIKEDLLDPFEGTKLHAELLFYALKSKNEVVIRHLLNFDVPSDLSFYSFCGVVPVALALEENSEDIVFEVLEKSDKNFALHTAVKLKNDRLKEFLLKNAHYSDKFLHHLELKPDLQLEKEL